MATANITLNACGGSSDSMKIYYGKTLLVTGTPLSGTGWTFHTGSPFAASTTSVTITSLDDNVEYTFYRYCHCPVNGDTDPEIIGPEIKYECPTFQTTSSGSNQIDYVLSIPASSNNSGTWIQTIVIDLLDSTGSTIFSSNTHNSPFSSSASGSFTGLIPNTSYILRIKYSNILGTMSNICSTTNISTQPPCTAPTIQITNLQSTSFDVSWSVPQTFSGDLYSIVLNSSTIASSIPFGSQPYSVTGLTPNTNYSVQVIRNCGFGGTSNSNIVNILTPQTVISGVITVDCTDVGCTQQGRTTLSITFSNPTPVPITLYFASKYQSGPLVGRSGYEIIPDPLQPGEFNEVSNIGLGSCAGQDQGPRAYKLDIPSGTTVFNSTSLPSAGGPCAAGEIHRRIVCFNTSPAVCFSSWICHSCLSSILDLYVKINSPVGYLANFSIGGGSNPSGIVIHNIP